MKKKKVITLSCIGLATLGLAVVGFFQRRALKEDFEDLRDSIRSLLEEEPVVDE